MAGGIGSRFWPMSTPECPKQFIDVMGCGRSLIQLTADRFDGVCPRENMWVVTSEKYIDIVREQLPEIPESNILAEPCARNTAPCIAFACWKIKKKHMSIGHCLLATPITVLSLASWQPVITSISNDMLHNNMNPLDFFNKFPVILFVLFSLIRLIYSCI